MSDYVAEVFAAPNSKTAMVAIAAGIDEILARLSGPAPEAAWDEWSEPAPAPGRAVEIQTPLFQAHHTETTAEIEIAPTSPKKMAQRALFERQVLKLANSYGNEQDWTEVYAKGGPLWLYMTDREFVAGLPYPIRQMMVSDVMEDDPDTAQEMGRDILKFAGESGPGSSAMMVADEL